MRNQIIITSSQVGKLKQQARTLKRSAGIPHHAALDQVAKAAGFDHWHHVSQSADAFRPTEQAYYFGVIIAMDAKDAMDFRDASGRFVEDDAAFVLCADDIYSHIRETEKSGFNPDTDPDYENDRLEWMHDQLIDFVFFRDTHPTAPSSVNEVVELVRKCSFWPPEFIWFKGSFQESPSDQAVDEDGNIVGVRFNFP